MKKFILLPVLLSVVLVLTLTPAYAVPQLAPTAERSAKPYLSLFHSTVTLTEIDEGEVTKLGSLHWLVNDRPMGGEISGDVGGNFTYTYDAVVNLLQTGYSWGTVDIDCGDGNTIQGRASGWMITYRICLSEHTAWSHFSGTFKFESGTGIYEGIWGRGVIRGNTGIQLDENNEHVVEFLEGSSLEMCGLWNEFGTNPHGRLTANE